MKFVKDLIQKLDAYFSKDEQVLLKKQKEDFDSQKQKLQSEIDATAAVNRVQEIKIRVLERKVEEKEDIRMFKSLEDFKSNVQGLRKERIPYRWNGKDSLPCHNQIQDVPVDDYLAYIKDVLRIDIDKYNLETAIYQVSNKIHRKYPNSLYYKSEKIDKWETPTEALKKFIAKEGDDCDTHGALIYGCVYSITHKKDASQLWRVKVAIVELLDKSWHYVVIWGKETVNDWVVIETTYHKQSFNRTWMESLPLRLQVAYEVQWIFDDHSEYRGI